VIAVALLTISKKFIVEMLTLILTLTIKPRISWDYPIPLSSPDIHNPPPTPPRLGSNTYAFNYQESGIDSRPQEGYFEPSQGKRGQLRGNGIFLRG